MHQSSTPTLFKADLNKYIFHVLLITHIRVLNDIEIALQLNPIGIRKRSTVFSKILRGGGAFGPNNWERKLKFCMQPLIVVIYIERLNLTYFHWFHILTSGGHWYLEVKGLQAHLRSKRSIRMESVHLKTYDLILHITYFHWFHILSSGQR